MAKEQTDHPGLVIDATASHRLFQSGLAALVLGCAYLLWRNSDDLSLAVYIGVGILIFACVPALQWARHNSNWFPAFEISCLSGAVFYALPLLLGHSELSAYPPSAVSGGGLLVLIYLAMANLGFSVVRNPIRAPRWALESLIPEGIDRSILVAVFLNTVFLYISNFTTLIPSSIDGTLRALFFGLGNIGTFVLCQRWGAERLGPSSKIWFVVNLITQLILMFSQLYLIGGISLLILACVAYASARRRIPWLALLICLPLLALLHQGKGAMRTRYWAEGAPTRTLASLPDFFVEWGGYGLAREHEDEAARRRSSIFERASLIQMLCLSVDRVPELKPHLNGESYVDIPALVIPRFLWPEKPSSLLANVRLALYFNLVSVESALTVSIAFGMIAEAYINFGHIGVATLGVLFGIALKRISLMARDVPQFSAVGILMILLTAWSFQSELVLATWLSSLFQACVVCIGIPLAYHKFTTS